MMALSVAVLTVCLTSSTVCEKQIGDICCRIESTFLPPTNEVWGKVMFKQSAVILSGGGGFPACITGHMTGREGWLPREGSLHPRVWADPPIRSTSEWYASY